MKLLLLLLPLACSAQQLAVSQTFFASSQAADVASSIGKYELNPLLGRAPFGARQATIKAGVTTLAILAENHVVKKHPAWRRSLIVANYVAGGVTFGVAGRNWSRRP